MGMRLTASAVLSVGVRCGGSLSWIWVVSTNLLMQIPAAVTPAGRDR